MAEKFEKKLLNILNSSANAKAWSDLLPTTKEILLLLNKNQKDIDFSQLSIKHILAKRLAQCLNPEFPNGVHEVVLDIYKIIITNIMVKQDMQLMDNLALYCSGLFPFFSHASLQNKEKFLNDIVKLNLLSIDPDELTLCFPGLLASLIPGLDDNNESTTKLIFQAFEDFITKLNNKQTFFGSYWTLLLRNKHLRSSGMKYLAENIIKYSELKTKTKEEQKTIIENYYPNINTTVVNALSEIIKEEEIPTVRIGMDFILSRFPLTKDNNIITDKAKINLIINALHSLIRNDSSVVRRLNNWILGIENSDDDVNYKSEDMKYKMNLIAEAFKKIFNYHKNYSSEELLNKLKILEGFFENIPRFRKFILPKISYYVLKCIVNYWQIELNGSENVHKNEIVSKISNFFSKKKGKNIELLWISLADKLKAISGIEKIEENNKNENVNRETSDTSIPSNENSSENLYNILLSEMNDNIDLLKFCLLFIDIKDNDEKIIYYLPIITHLLNIIKKIKIIDRESLKDIRHIVLLTLVFIKSLQEKKEIPYEEIENQLANQLYGNSKTELDENITRPIKKARPSVFQAVINLDDLLYNPKNIINKGKYSIENYSSLQYILKMDKIDSKIIDSLTESILSYQEFYILVLCQYFKITKDMQITKYEISLLKQCTELVLRLQEYSRQDGVLPLWVYYLEKLIFYPIVNIKISFEAANYFLDVCSSSFNNSQIYENIKYNFFYIEVPKTVIDNEVLQNIMQKTSVQNNCYELIMGKLYLLLLEQNNQREVIDILIKIIELSEEKFEYMILKTISNNNVEGIKLFSEFWKLLYEFKPESDLFKSGICIFTMIDYLSESNPLLRHLSKTWLNQVNQRFSKILDPIIGLFLCDDINLLFEGQYIYFEKEYDTTTIIKAFSRLKNIILNSPIISFLMDEKAMEYENVNLEKIGNPTLATLNYLCLLISIALRFTQARCKDDVNNKFKEESYSVNAASCEFLEFLVNIISDGELLINVANEINRPLLNLLDTAIESNDEVMQVQLLAIIKILDFNTSAQNYNQDKKNIILSLLKDDLLSKVLIKGMTSGYYFVRENFINFTKNCLPVFGSIIVKKLEFENIFGLGINFIYSLTKYLANIINIEKIGRKDNEKFSHFDDENNKLIFKNYLEEYKEYKSYDENDVLLILKGIKDILLYFLSLDYNDSENIKEKKENLSSSFNPINIFKKNKSKSLTLNNSTLFNIINNVGVNITTNEFDGNWVEFKRNLVTQKQNNRNYIFTISEDNSSKDNRKSEKEEDISLIPNNLYKNKIYILINGLILTWVNQSDKYEVYDYCLNINGILAPTEINSWNNISPEDLKIAKENIKQNPIKKIVVEIAFNLFCSNSIQFIEKILDIWCFGQKGLNNNLCKVNACIDKQYQLSIIELLIAMNIPVNIILYCINQILYDKIKWTEAKNKKYIKDSKTKTLKTPYDFSLYEAKIFHFIYSYILLNPIYDKKETIEIWKEMTNIFYTIINNSKILYTFCWIYEVMQLSLDKFQIKNLDNNEVIKSIYDIFNIITTKLMDASFDNKLDSQYSDEQKLVMPILPHVYTNIVKEIYQKDNLYKKDTGGGKLKKENELNIKLENLNTMIGGGSFSYPGNEQAALNEEKLRGMTFAIIEKEKGTLSTFYDEYYNELIKSSEYNTESDEELNNIQGHGILNIIYRQIAMITLKENYFTLYSSIFGEKITEIKKQLTEILKGIINLTKSKDSFLKECASGFLVSLMEDCPKTVTKLGKELIMNYFNDPNFFKTDSINLHNWRKIISHYADYYPEIITDLLNNIEGKNLFLTKTSDDDKIRILRRISFVIYSCKKDTFSKQFDLIQSKAKDLLSGYSSNNNLIEGEIFLIMRILFLRFSHEGVMKMIRDLWPIIFNELIQNIEDEDRNKHIHLLAESFKFIELLSLANIEEFSLYEWIFIMDTYNMKYLDTRKEDSMLNRLLSSENKAFKPLALNILSKGNLEVTDSLLEGKHKGKSELYIRTKKDTFEELFKGVKKFFYSIIDMNSYKVPVNFEQIEQIIEEDFIDHNREE